MADSFKDLRIKPVSGALRSAARKFGGWISGLLRPLGLVVLIPCEALSWENHIITEKENGGCKKDLTTRWTSLWW